MERRKDLKALGARLSATSPLLLLSPPRGNSSAFATAIGRHSQVSGYIHEPCGLYSYEDVPVSVITDALGDSQTGALIKEMTFQMRDPLVAKAFLNGCRSPIVFLVRSPLLTIESRVRLVLTDIMNDPQTPQPLKQRIETAIEGRHYGDLDDVVTEGVFPIFRTGWADLGDQLRACRESKIPYLVVETQDFRRQPKATLESLCLELGWRFEPEMLTWASGTARLPGALERHKAWYERVTTSVGIQPPDERMPKAEDLPPRFQAHLPLAFSVFESALSDPARVVRPLSQ